MGLHTVTNMSECECPRSRYDTLANPKIEVGTCERKQCKRNSMDEKFFC